MPFGFTGAPNTYQRLMNSVLSDLQFDTCLEHWCPEAYPIPNQKVTRKLVDEFICCFGAPKILDTDQGRDFQSKLCRLLGIENTRTSTYYRKEMIV
ncbi:hypothetical protein QZH41_006351 [Actinostola sp. cb2023]|nr:hypothetical protein QZH41_006351 [Actinostola sp. cb2023]